MGFFIQKSSMAASCVDRKGKWCWGECNSKFLWGSYRLKYLRCSYLFFSIYLLTFPFFSPWLSPLFTTGGLLRVAFDSSFSSYHVSFRLSVNIQLLWATSDMTFWWESQCTPYPLNLRSCHRTHRCHWQKLFSFNGIEMKYITSV